MNAQNHSNSGEPFAGMKQLGGHLLRGRVDTSNQKRLEPLAQRLECERAAIARQLRWR